MNARNAVSSVVCIRNACISIQIKLRKRLFSSFHPTYSHGNNTEILYVIPLGVNICISVGEDLK